MASGNQRQARMRMRGWRGVFGGFRSGFCKVTWPTGGGVRELWAVHARAQPSASSGTCWPEGPLVAPNR